MMPQPSIYRSQASETAVLALYDDLLDALNVGYQERVIDTRFGSTHVLVIGPEGGLPVVTVHGGNEPNPYALKGLLPLAERYRIYALDTIGHPGKSAQTRLSPRDASYGEWLVDVLNGLDLDNVPVIAGSFGGGIMLRAAAFAPERISHAVLIVPSGIVSPPITSLIFDLTLPMVAYRLKPGRERLVKAARPLFDEIGEDDLRVIAAAFDHVRIAAEMPRPATRRELANFSSPTLVIAAEKDVLFPGDAVIRRAREIFPNLVAAERIDGAGHAPTAEGYAYINRRIREFFLETGYAG
jgi:pimeloyl-ACP methyl ester carboxylesterase